MNLLQRVIAIALTASLLLVLGVPTLFVTWFKIDQDRIAATLCVQKEIPENSCQGACQMTEMLKKVDNETEKGTVPDPSRIETLQIQMLLEENSHSLFEEYRMFKYLTDVEYPLCGVSNLLFRPPASFMAA